MRLMVTGTRQGMTVQQRLTFRQEVTVLLPVLEWRDGDCTGVDQQAHEIVSRLSPRPWMVGHPGVPIGHEFRAGSLFDELLPVARDPIVRNKVMVDRSDRVLALPAQVQEQRRRSGTWATIRYARRVGRPLTIVWPDGSVLRERWES